MRKAGVLSILIAVALLSVAVIAEAQQPKKVTRVGFLTAASPPLSRRALRHSGRACVSLDTRRGKTSLFEYLYADGKADRERESAAELVRLKVDVIVTGGPTSTRAAKEATATIPIVMGFDNDPVGSGFVATLARPGGNITGLSALSPELSGKRLELLKVIVPGLSRLTVFGNPTEPGNAESLKETDLAAGAFKVQLQYLDVLRFQGY